MLSWGIELVGQAETDRSEDEAIEQYVEQRIRLEAMAGVVAAAVRSADSLARLECALIQLR